MLHVMLPNLELVFFFICFIVENFKKVFICRLAMGNIVIYHTTIILNILYKVADYIEFRVVEGWLT